MPIVFVSAVSKELASARQLVANTLTFQGYDPQWQDVFGTGSGELLEMLRRRIDASRGVVQLVGKAYGAEPAVPDERFGRVSFTQYEALYARSRGKRVWYLVIEDGFPTDAYEPEPEELRALQARYRESVRGDAHLFHALGTPDALKVAVHELRDDLTSLRRGLRIWAVVVAALLVAAVGLGAWVVTRQGRSSDEVREARRDIALLRTELARFTRDAEGRLRPEEGTARTYTVSAEEAAALDREREAIEAETARFNSGTDAMNEEKAELERVRERIDERDPEAVSGFQAQVSAHNERASQWNAALSALYQRMEAYQQRLERVGKAVR